MKKRLQLQDCARALWRRTAGRAVTLLAALLLWLTAVQAMAESVTGVAVYDKTTGVLTLDAQVGSGVLPGQDENQEVYYLLDTGKYSWFETWSDGYFDRFNWSETTRQATRVVIKEGFQKYNTMPTCRAMFKNFVQLKTIEGLEYLIPNNETVTDMGEMFAGCQKLESLAFPSSFQTEKITNMGYMFYDCYALKELDLSKWKTWMVEDMSYMFANCGNLKTLDMSGLRMQCVKDMSCMFSGCTSLPGVRLQVNSGDLVNMQYMFYNCSSLTEVNLRPLAHIHNVKKMNNLFDSCEKLLSVNMSGLDASRVENMSQMFAWCEELKSVNMTGFKTRDVTNTSNMFYVCRKLDGLDLSGFSTEKLTDMGGMFCMCEQLTALDVSGFNTARVTNMDQMFSGCTQLASLDVSSFYTALVTNMNSMFSMCESLTALDLSSWNTARVTDMSGMFAYCTQLRDIYVGDGFTTAAAIKEDFPPMFSGCTSLPGFDNNERGKTRAHYGDGGYLLKLAGRVGGRKIGARGNLLTADKVTMADGEDLEVYSPFTARELTYTRQMDDLQWQAAYLPFPIAADGLPEGYMAAAINDFHEYAQQDGTCRVELVAQQLSGDESIEALTPLLLRRTQEGAEPLTLRAEDVELTTDMIRESTCASVERLYTFRSTMQTMYTPGNQDTYFLQDGDLMMDAQPRQLPAGRWCMTVSSRPGSTLVLALPECISVRVAGDATGISSATAREDSGEIYDLQGRRLDREPVHGVYIKNGRKYVK